MKSKEKGVQHIFGVSIDRSNRSEDNGSNTKQHFKTCWTDFVLFVVVNTNFEFQHDTRHLQANTSDGSKQRLLQVYMANTAPSESMLKG